MDSVKREQFFHEGGMEDPNSPFSGKGFFLNGKELLLSGGGFL